MQRHEMEHLPRLCTESDVGPMVGNARLLAISLWHDPLPRGSCTGYQTAWRTTAANSRLRTTSRRYPHAWRSTRKRSLGGDWITGMRLCASSYAEARTTTLGRKGPMSSTGPRWAETTLSNSSTEPSPALPAARRSWPHTFICRPPAWTTAYRAHTSMSEDLDLYLLVELVDLDRNGL